MTERYRIVAKIAVFWPTSAPFVAIRDRLLSNVRLAKWVAAVRGVPLSRRLAPPLPHLAQDLSFARRFRRAVEDGNRS